METTASHDFPQKQLKGIVTAVLFKGFPAINTEAELAGPPLDSVSLRCYNAEAE